MVNRRASVINWEGNFLGILWISIGDFIGAVSLVREDIAPLSVSKHRIESVGLQDREDILEKSLNQESFANPNLHFKF